MEAKGLRSGGQSLAGLAATTQRSGHLPWFRDTRVQNTFKHIGACMPESPTRAKKNPEMNNILLLRPPCHLSPQLGLRGQALSLEAGWLVPGLKEQAGLRTALKGKQPAGIQNTPARWEAGVGLGVLLGDSSPAAGQEAPPRSGDPNGGAPPAPLHFFSPCSSRTTPLGLPAPPRPFMFLSPLSAQPLRSEAAPWGPCQPVISQGSWSTPQAPGIRSWESGVLPGGGGWRGGPPGLLRWPDDA